MTSNRFAFADGLRAIAAFWVVLYHLHEGQHITNLTKFVGPFLTMLIFEHGNLGVPVFFVLSGFVMAVTTQNKSIGIKQSLMFMLRRIIRLTPPYYVAIIFAFLVIWVKLQFGDSYAQLPTWGGLFAHIFYLQGLLEFPQINVVFWTLCYEMQFYLIFSIFIYFVSQRNSGAISYFLIVFVMTFPSLLWLVFIPNDSLIYSFVHRHLIFIYYWYAFCSGVLVGWFSQSKRPFQSYLILFYVFLIVFGYFNGDMFALAAGLTSFIIHLAIKYNKMNEWLNQRPLQLLGMVSYSLYLTHNNIIGLFGRLFRLIFERSVIYDFLFVILSLIVCIFGAFVMYWLVEIPAIKFSKKIKY